MREADRAWLRWVAPLFGFLFAASLHALWNAAATISGMLVMLMLPLWFVFICAFFGIIVWLVWGHGVPGIVLSVACSSVIPTGVGVQTTAAITGLAPGAIYYDRLVASNTEGPGSGQIGMGPWPGWNARRNLTPSGEATSSPARAARSKVTNSRRR